MVRNIYRSERKRMRENHSGIGWIEVSRIFESTDFSANIDFVDYAIIPPGSSIGFHQHIGNEEFYLVLEGKGMMRVGEEMFGVAPGDLIINRDGYFHGLENNNDTEIHIFVVQVATRSSKQM